MIERKFKKYDNFVFDLDGTVWNWDNLIPKAINLFSILKKEKKNVYFVTNNTALTLAGFAKKLQNFGIDAIVMGGDWEGHFDHLRDLGVKVIYLPRTEATSTTDIKKKVLKIGDVNV